MISAPERGTPVRARLALDAAVTEAHRRSRPAPRSCSQARSSPTAARSRRAAPARAPLPDELDPRVRERDRRRRALRAPARRLGRGRARRAPVVTTGTASGKTLAFNLPVLDALARDPKSRALYLYPTKALAQDQFRTLNALPRAAAAGPRSTTATRRSSSAGRSARWANVILTNPDMVHIGLLPHHDRWGDVLANLRYVVVDEAHVYRGVFGSHVANVLRRLRRLARIYGAEPQFLLASATISNPGELARDLLGDRVTVIGDDAAPRAERTVVLWNPPLLDEELGLRGSALAEAAKLQAGFVERGLRTLTFAKSRKAAELIHRFTAERLGDDSRLSPYRAGYTAEQRREIERRLAEGELLGVSATNALELGIDVGLLDAVISVGFPGTVASLRQQWGRAGRRGHGLAVLVATEDALDQYFMREPDKLLGRRVEAAILDHANRACARRPRPGGRVRGADRRGRRARSSATRRSPPRAADPELRAHAARIRLGGRATTRRHASRCARPMPTPSRSSTAATGARARPRRALARVHDRAPGRRLPAPRRVATSCASSTSATLRAVVEPFTRRLVHAGEEGDPDDDRPAAARRAAARARRSSSARSR